MTDAEVAHVRALVLDATPLITQSYSHYQSFAQSFYTTPTVFGEIRDGNARKNLEIWQSLGTLKLRHPSQDSIKRVSAFAKLTGDFVVLSANDIHILALAYELEKELNKGDWRLRKYPGESLEHLQTTPAVQKLPLQLPSDKPKETEKPAEDQPIKKKGRRRGGKKQRAKQEERQRAGENVGQLEKLPEPDSEEQSEVKSPSMHTRKVLEANSIQKSEAEKPVQSEAGDASAQPEKTLDNQSEQQDDSNGEYDDDDGDWISMDNLTEAIIRDSGEDVTGSRGVIATEEERTRALTSSSNQVALATGDFAVQNVALQLNLNLMNFMSGLRIRTLRNYMLRCHACFKMFPMPKDGRPKHFCPACGGEGSLLRCAVSVDAATGQVTPHLKANFQWSHRGNRYSIASPLSKNSQKKYGKRGYVHAKPQETPILREDQKEYKQMMSQEDWTRRHNEKVLDNWIGGGSADNYMSPFAIQGLKHHSVRVGRGRYVNSSGKKR